MRDDCRTIGQQLLEYVYRELDETWRLRVERHLDQCPRCRADLENLRSTLELIDEATLEPEEQLSEHFSNVVLALLQRRVADRSWPFARTATAAALLMVFLFHYGVETPRSLTPPPQPPRAVAELKELAKSMADPLIEEIAERTGELQRGIFRIPLRG
jgi:anti-sigma factor RsiW